MNTHELLMTDGIYPVEEISLQDNKIERKQFVRVPNKLIDDAIFLFTGYTMYELRIKNRSAEAVGPRQMAMFFYRLNGNSYNNIAIHFHRDKATAMHSMRKVSAYYGQPSEYNLTYLADSISKHTGIEIEIKTI